MAIVLVVSGNQWVEANLTEKDLTTFIGQAVMVNVDTYPGSAWKGIVESLSPATGSEFSIIPAQNATGNWVKIAQRVAVRIRLEDAPNLPRLRSGLSAEVKIDTGHRRAFWDSRSEKTSMNFAAAASTESRHRTLITLSVMLATIMQALDTTIAMWRYRTCREPWARPRSRSLGADVLHRGGRDLHAAHRVSHQPFRTQTDLHVVGGRIHVHRCSAARPRA